MADAVQLRSGSSAQIANFKGAAGELSYDTQKNLIQVHDNVLTGGHEQVNLNSPQTLNLKTLASDCSFPPGHVIRQGLIEPLTTLTSFTALNTITYSATLYTITNVKVGDTVIVEIGRFRGYGVSGSVAFMAAVEIQGVTPPSTHFMYQTQVSKTTQITNSRVITGATGTAVNVPIKMANKGTSASSASNVVSPISGMSAYLKYTIIQG